jgi:hypothetical protein
LLNDQWVIDEIREEIKRSLEVNENENENATCQNLWGTAKAELRGEFTAMSAFKRQKDLKSMN